MVKHFLWALLVAPLALGFTPGRIPSNRPLFTQPPRSEQQQQGLRRLTPLALSTADFKNGLTIEFEGTPMRVIEFLHVKPGKGSAFVRTKLKNLLNGQTLEKTWRAGESVGAADVNTVEVQFTYEDGSNYAFMNMESFEELLVPGETVDDVAKWLKEGTECKVAIWNDKVIQISVPTSMTLMVSETEPGIKGNTAQGVTKPATLETGAVVTVPGFIAEGEMVIVNTEKCEYTGRAKE